MYYTYLDRFSCLSRFVYFFCICDFCFFIYYSLTHWHMWISNHNFYVVLDVMFLYLVFLFLFLNVGTVSTWSSVFYSWNFVNEGH